MPIAITCLICIVIMISAGCGGAKLEVRTKLAPLTEEPKNKDKNPEETILPPRQNDGSVNSNNTEQDTENPQNQTLALTFSINSGAAYSGSASVTLELSDDSGVTEYRKANGSDCSAASWATYSTPILHTLDAGDGLKTVCLEVRDSQLHSSATETATITLDQTAPDSSFTIANHLGPHSTAGANTTVSGTADDGAGSGVSSLHLTFKNTVTNKYLDGTNFDSDDPVWVLATGTDSWTYSLSDAVLSNGVTYEISSRATDALGHEQSALSTNSFTWDDAAPSALFSIDGGASYTKNLSVTLTLTDVTGVAEYRKANGADCSSASWVAYLGPISHSLTAGDASKTVCLEVRDSLLNASSTETDTITLDQTAPGSSFSVANNLGPASTVGPNTTISGTASDAGSGVSTVELAFRNTSSNLYLNAGVFNSATPVWHTATGDVTWAYDVADSVFSHGVTYEILSRATDVAGNAQSSFTTDSFTWDNVAPAASFVINNNDVYTNSANVTLTLADATDVDQYRVANGADCSAAIWTAYSGSISHALTAGDGLKTVCLQVRDSVQNASSTETDTITLDDTKPTSSPTIAAFLDEDSTAGATTVLTGTASDGTGSGVTSVDVSIKRNRNDNFCLNASKTDFDAACPVWHAVSGTTTWSLTLNDSLFEIGDHYAVTSRATDLAGHVQTEFGFGGFNWGDLIIIPSSYSGLGYDYYIMAFEASWAAGGSAPGGDSVATNEADLATCNYEFHVNQVASHANCGTKAISKVAQSKMGQTPANNVSFAEAFYGCRNASDATFMMRLPTTEEWNRATKWIGTDYNSMWTTYTANTGNNCLVSNGSAANTGSRSDCKTPLNVFDMAGNVREWVDSRMVNYDIDGAGESRFSYGPVIGRTLMNGIDNISRRFHTITPGAGGLALTMGADYTTPALADRKQVGPDVQTWTDPTTQAANIGFRCVAFRKASMPSMADLALPLEPQYTSADISGAASTWKIPENLYVKDTRPEELKIVITGDPEDDEAEGEVQISWKPWRKRICNPSCNEDEWDLVYKLYRFIEPNRVAQRPSVPWAITGGTNPYSSDKPLDPLAVDISANPLFTSGTSDGRLIASISNCDSGNDGDNLLNCTFTDKQGIGTDFSPRKLYNYLLVVEDAAGNKITAMTQRYRSPYFAGDFAAGGTAAFRLEPRYRRAAVFLVDEEHQQAISTAASQIMVHVPMDQSGLDHDFFIHKYITSDYVAGTLDTDTTRSSWPLQGNNGTWVSNAARCHEIFMRTLSFDNAACGNGSGVNTTTRTLQSKQDLAPTASIRQGAFWKACRNSSFADEDGNAYNLHLASDPEWLKAADWGDVNLDGVIDQSVYTANLGLTIHGTVEYSSGADNTTIRCHSDSNPGGVLNSNSTGAGSTENCRSRYGVADMVGNVFEWTAGQICDRVGYDNGMDGLWLGQSFHASTTTVSTIGKYDLLRGLPKASGAPALSAAAANGDYYYQNTGLRGSFRGGPFNGGAYAGRWFLYVLNDPSNSGTDVGGRCAR